MSCFSCIGLLGTVWQTTLEIIKLDLITVLIDSSSKVVGDRDQFEGES